MPTKITESQAVVIELSREAFADGWTLEDDYRFWRQLRGRSGLLQLRRDARRITASCLRLSRHRSDRAFLIHRLRIMTVCIWMSYPESAARVVCTELPHFFPRFAAQLFCEILSRAELVVEENAYVFGERGRAETRPDTYRSPARATAG